MVYTAEIKDPKKQLAVYKELYLNVLNKLKQYEFLEEEGLILKLPIKVGDIVLKDNVEFRVHTLSYTVREINILDNHIRYFATPCKDELDEINDICFLGDEIGDSLVIKEG